MPSVPFLAQNLTNKHLISVLKIYCFCWYKHLETLTNVWPEFQHKFLAYSSFLHETHVKKSLVLSRTAQNFWRFSSKRKSLYYFGPRNFLKKIICNRKLSFKEKNLKPPLMSNRLFLVEIERTCFFSNPSAE